MALLSHIYCGVFLNGSVDVAQEEDPLLICVSALGKGFIKQVCVQVVL